MKKIVLITEVMEKGVGKHIIDLFTFFSSDSNIDISILYGSSRVEPQFQRIIDNNKDKFIKVENLKRNIGFGDIKSVFEILKILKEINPDIVHCHSSKAGLSGRIASRLMKISDVYYSPHAYFFLKYTDKSFKRKLFRFAEKILSRKCTKCTIATSKGEQNAYISNHIDKFEKCVMIEHGVDIPKIESKDLQSYRQQYGIDDCQILIGAMARLEYQKDPITTMKIMRNIVENNENVSCILFGNGSMQETIMKIHNEIPEIYRKRVIIAGETTTPELSIASLDIYLTTSLYEGLPYTLLMALGYQKPILATNVEGNRDCVVDGVNGFLFNSGDFENAVNLYKKMVDQPELMKKMSQESQNIYNERFSMTEMKHKYQELYLKVKK